MTSSRTYPKQFQTVIKANDGTEVLVRPLKPEDREKLYQMYASLSKETNYLRFLTRKPITRWLVEQWTEIDYRDKMALVAIVNRNGEQEIIADSRFYVDQATGEAEIAMVVHDHWQNKGIGTKLLQYTIEVARKMGIKGLFAYINPENKRIIHITNKLGFKANWISETIEYKIHLPLQK
ncbi:MAG: GNAT family N-acetyltransferase [Candidatus Jordarchaeum sp.]|uniref:GNAT family N-acetyltransferase n=1 Tax=Candidatus Jordarchaeum sp. TaxID=2823881 RepID=UPI00404A9ED6